MGILDKLPPILPAPLPPPQLFKKHPTDVIPDERIPLSELLQRNGWGSKSSDNNRRARGVIGCESTNDANAENNAPCAPGEHAVGLMQICTVHRGKMGIPRDKTEAVKYLKDPDKNVRVGRALLRSQGWGAWTCSNSPTDADPEITLDKKSLFSPSDIADAVTDPLLQPIDEIAKFFGLLTQADTWLRIGKVALGTSFLAMGGIALIFTGGRVVAKSKVVKTGLAVSPVGRAAPTAVRTARRIAR